ncbi:MAG TPA: DNA polymerase Y family protein [Anaeromyxobacteraceae bacterium]|nr:DNA polymerase Y family protein [Anaeromyxobacteraceae bacterium]
MPPESPARCPRVLAVVLPELPLQRALRARSAHGPLAVVEEEVVIHCTGPARAAGVRPGDTLVQARAACAGLAAVPLDRAGDRGALRALAEAMLALSPTVEVAPPDGLLLDAAAVRLAGEGEEEAELRLAERALALCRSLGWRGRAALAGGKGPAQALARHGAQEMTRAAPLEAGRALGRLPLAALALTADMEERLAAVGVTDVGALSRLPAETLAHRFGPAGAAAARLARGEDPRPLVPFVPETFPEESWDLEGTEVGVLSSAEPLLFAVKRLADRVATRLAGRELGAEKLRLTLLLDPRGEERLDLPLARPSADASLWMVPLRERVGALRLPAPVRALKLAVVEAAGVPVEQLSVGDRPEAARALDVVLARLAARLGEASLFAAEDADRYLPEAAYRLAPFDAGSLRGVAREAGRNGAAGHRRAVPGAGVANGEPPPAVRPTRLLQSPRPIIAEGEGGRLTVLRVDGRAHPVVALAGPERLGGEWWSHPFERDYYRVRLAEMGDLWVYRDGRDGRLYLHGFFD